MGLFTFIPLWEIHNGHGEAYGTFVLALFLFAGAVGTLLGGPLADRFGRRPVLRGSFVAATPLILVYVLVGGPIGVRGGYALGRLCHRNLRSQPRDEPGVHAGPRRHGLRALDRARDRARRCRGARPRRPRGHGRPRDRGARHGDRARHSPSGSASYCRRPRGGAWSARSRPPRRCDLRVARSSSSPTSGRGPTRRAPPT